MRRFLMMIFVLLMLLACRSSLFPFFQPTETPTSTISPPTVTPYPPTSTATETPTLTPSPQPSSTPATISNTPGPWVGAFSVLYHPDDVLYVGDLVSFEVISPPEADLKDASVGVQVDPPDGPTFGPVTFGAWGIQGREEATFLWAWDTHNLDPITHTLAFSVQPQGYDWSEQVALLPASDMPPAQANAHWSSTQSHCCSVFYVSDTASERDLPTLTSLIDAQAQDAIQKMGSSFTEPITVTLLPRLLGHGGFTSSEISVSYLDRNYASNSWALVVHHEMIHAIDGHLGGDFRPSIFVEGLAVYMTGGHYKPEPLMPRAAALLKGYLDMYIPLKDLADNFYMSQHEIGYLEGASLIEYMVNTYGWDAFSRFYRDIHLNKGESQSDAINAALTVHFSTSFARLEQEFISALSNEKDTSTWVDDVHLTVNYYDTLRRYQQLLDPSAYFRTAWLLDNKTMRERGIVADYLRHPHQADNLALETLFITAGQQMSDKSYSAADQILTTINSVLDGIEHGTTDPFSISSLAADYISIASTSQKEGYEVQSITITVDAASVTATTSAGPDLRTLQLQRIGGEWLLIP